MTNYKIMRDFHGRFWVRDLTAKPKDTAVKDERGLILEFDTYAQAFEHVEGLDNEINQQTRTN